MKFAFPMSTPLCLDTFLSVVKPMGKGVTQTVFPSSNPLWVIKLAQVHDPSRFHSLQDSVGWDGFKDGAVNAHCATMERLVQTILSRHAYPFVPVTLHTTHIPIDLFPARHLSKIADSYLCDIRQNIAVQISVQERVNGITLSDAIICHSKSWSVDDWRSVLVQICCTLCHLQQAFGYIQFDSHANNVIVQTKEEPQQFCFQINDTLIESPPSRLVLKWIDTSSVLLLRAMPPLEAKRACAQRAWFNMYFRRAYKIHPYVVPCSVSDWLNLLASIKHLLKDRECPALHSFLDSAMENTIIFAFRHAYATKQFFSMAEVQQLVQRDQVDNACWTLPHSFWDVDPALMASVCRGLCGCLIVERDRAVAPMIQAPSFDHSFLIDAKHFEPAHTNMLHKALAQADPQGPSLLLLSLASKLFSTGNLFIPVLSRQTFVGNMSSDYTRALLKHVASQLVSSAPVFSLPESTGGSSDECVHLYPLEHVIVS
jgi:hypothetical protein